MGYYMRGDYYRGDYYRGDPFLGGLIGAAARSVGAGAIVAKAGRWLLGKVGGMTAAGAAKTAAKVAVGAAGTAVVAKGLPKINIGPLTVDPGSALPGGEPLFQWGRGGKRYRRMNPLNPKALKRALRRAEGFEKFAKSTVNALYKTVDGRRVHTFKRSRKRAS